jgi:prepilin-type N-terminal cleavage/methylation domain-containing protein
MQRLRAFTLIEVMLVVAILGVMFAVAVPLLRPQVHKAQLDSAGDALAALLFRARTEAVKSKRCTRVWINAPRTIVVERLNGFDCDIAPATLAPATGLDGSSRVWVPFDGLTVPSSLTLTFLQAPDESDGAPVAPGSAVGAPAGFGGAELRFRPNGRVWTDVLSMS